MNLLLTFFINCCSTTFDMIRFTLTFKEWTLLRLGTFSQNISSAISRALTCFCKPTNLFWLTMRLIFVVIALRFSFLMVNMSLMRRTVVWYNCLSAYSSRPSRSMKRFLSAMSMWRRAMKLVPNNQWNHQMRSLSSTLKASDWYCSNDGGLASLVNSSSASSFSSAAASSSSSWD